MYRSQQGSFRSLLDPLMFQFLSWWKLKEKIGILNNSELTRNAAAKLLIDDIIIGKKIQNDSLWTRAAACRASRLSIKLIKRSNQGSGDASVLLKANLGYSARQGNDRLCLREWSLFLRTGVRAGRQSMINSGRWRIEALYGQAFT